MKPLLLAAAIMGVTMLILAVALRPSSGATPIRADFMLPSATPEPTSTPRGGMPMVERVLSGQSVIPPSSITPGPATVQPTDGASQVTPPPSLTPTPTPGGLQARSTPTPRILPTTPTPTATPVVTPSTTPTATPTPQFVGTNAGTIRVACIRYGSAASEYIQIHNAGTTPQSLNGWVLYNSSRGGPVFAFPSMILAAGSFVRVYTDDPPAGGLSFQVDYVIWNTGSAMAVIADGNGQVVTRATNPPACS